MKSHLVIAGFLGAALLVSTSGASAAGHANGFGEKGQILLTADRLLPIFDYTSSSITSTQGNVDLTTSRSGAGLSLALGRNLAIVDDMNVPLNVHAIPRLAFDVAVVPHLTVGGGLAFGFGLGGTNETQTANGNTVTTAKNDAPSATAIGIAPRVGYVLPLGDIVAFWPRAGIGIYSVSGSLDQTNGNTVTTVKQTDTLVSLDLDPQLVIVPLEHFFVHAGLLVNVPITGSRSSSSTTGGTTIDRTDDASVFHMGLSAGIGGWLDVF